MEFVKKNCKVCHNERKFLVDSQRDKQSICGNCWNWAAEPKLRDFSDDEYQVLMELVKEKLKKN